METTFMQNFGGQTKSIMVFLKVAYTGRRDFEQRLCNERLRFLPATID